MMSSDGKNNEGGRGMREWWERNGVWKGGWRERAEARREERRRRRKEGRHGRSEEVAKGGASGMK